MSEIGWISNFQDINTLVQKNVQMATHTRDVEHRYLFPFLVLFYFVVLKLSEDYVFDFFTKFCVTHEKVHKLDNVQSFGKQRNKVLVVTNFGICHEN